MIGGTAAAGAAVVVDPIRSQVTSIQLLELTRFVGMSVKPAAEYIIQHHTLTFFFFFFFFYYYYPPPPPPTPPPPPPTPPPPPPISVSV